jgi:hypothetical protein
MKIGDLFKSRDVGMYPSVEEIKLTEITLARKTFPNATDDTEALALSLSSYRRNYAERMEEKDRLIASSNELHLQNCWLRGELWTSKTNRVEDEPIIA